MSVNNLAKAKDLELQAEAALNKSGGFFSSMFGGNKNHKYEKAAELFNQAGTAYKLAKDMTKAGECYLKSAENYDITGENKTDANRAFIEASNCFRKDNYERACNILLTKVITYYNDSNNLTQSARYYKELAEIYEANADWKNAVENYKEAAQIYIDENKPASGTTSLQKVYTILGVQYDLFGEEGIKEAGKVLEQLAKESLKTKLGSFSAKGYLFQSVLCSAALGLPDQMQKKLEEYSQLDLSFPSSLEYELCKNLIDAFESYDIEAYNTAFENFEKISPLDNFKLKLKTIGQSKLNADQNLC